MTLPLSSLFWNYSDYSIKNQPNTSVQHGTDQFRKRVKPLLSLNIISHEI